MRLELAAARKAFKEAKARLHAAVKGVQHALVLIEDRERDPRPPANTHYHSAIPVQRNGRMLFYYISTKTLYREASLQSQDMTTRQRQLYAMMIDVHGRI